MSECTISNNVISPNFIRWNESGIAGSGGGLYSTASYTVVNCTFSGNQASDPMDPVSYGESYKTGIGGAICGSGTCTNCTFTKNRSGKGVSAAEWGFEGGPGGAIFGVNVSLVSCTVAENSTGANGFGTKRINPSSGGGITVTGIATLKNTIVAGNTAFSGRFYDGVRTTFLPATGYDVSGTIISEGHNLIGRVDGSTGIVGGTNGDLAGTTVAPLEPMVVNFGFHGGGTETLLLATGSPAIDAGDDTLTGTDQRGLPRLIGSHVDIGAVEAPSSDVPTVSFLTTASSVTESSGSVTLTVRRAGYTASAVSVNYRTIEGLSADYTAVSGTLNFAAGETEKTFAISIVNDTETEGDETFQVSLSSPSPGSVLGAFSVHVVTILANDIPSTIQFSAATSTVSETSAQVFVTLTRSETDRVASVIYNTVAGTATAGSDFSTSNGTVTFADGVAQQTISIPIVNDTAFETDEAFSIQLSSPSIGSQLGAITSHTVTIQSDDAAPPPPQISFFLALSSVEESSGFAVVSVRRSASLTEAVSVSYTTTSGSAIAGSDYTESNGTLNFAAFETQRTITVPITNDDLIEGDEAFSIQLSAPTNGAQLGTQTSHTVTVLVNDNLGEIGFAIPASAVSETVGNVLITITRSVTLGSVSVSYVTAGGTATPAGPDFESASGTVTFADGVAQQTISVHIYNDVDFEGDEAFSI